MDKKLQVAFNEQIKNEFHSGYLYLSMAAACESINLPGFSHWLKVQAKEEQAHAMKMFNFLIDTGVKILLQAIPLPDSEFSSPLEIFEKVLAHEKKVTALINKLYELSIELKDHASSVCLHWFINEQVEEEKNASCILETLKSIKADNKAAVIMLDRELAKREG